MEWDKIWALNRKKIDPISARFTVISEDFKEFNLESNNFDDQVVPLHPKNKEMGKKILKKYNKVILEK